MTEVFADSFYFIGLLNRSDQHHTAAMAASKRRDWRLLTTAWVLLETADALRDGSIRQTTYRFVHSALQGNHITVLSEFEWFKAGLELYGSRADKSWSLTDCISFSVMEARGIREALTGDQHFEQAGFVRLLVAGH